MALLAPHEGSDSELKWLLAPFRLVGFKRTSLPKMSALLDHSPLRESIANLQP